MNKLLFNEGGQPVYLDDLEMIQSEPLNQTGMLLKALGAGTSMFLMDGFTGKYLDRDSSGKSAYAVNRNWLVKDGTVYELPATSVVIGDGETLYVGLKTTEGDERNFDDGQSRACVSSTTAYYSTTKTDDSMVDVKSLKTLWELTAPLLQQATPTESYKKMDVVFENGFSGTVEYKNVGDAWRFRIDISSGNGSWNDTGTLLFSFKSPHGGLLNNFFGNVVVGVGEDNPTGVHSWLHSKDGEVYLEGIEEAKCPPGNCIIQTIFEVPYIIKTR